jgi:hypothetical protein
VGGVRGGEMYYSPSFVIPGCDRGIQFYSFKKFLAPWWERSGEGDKLITSKHIDIPYAIFHNAQVLSFFFIKY